MDKSSIVTGFDVVVGILLLISVFTLNSLLPSLFPQYYLFIAVALFLYFFVRRIDFEVFIAFSKIAYYVSVGLLLLTLIIGGVTRGTVDGFLWGLVQYHQQELFELFCFYILLQGL